MLENEMDVDRAPRPSSHKNDEPGLTLSWLASGISAFFTVVDHYDLKKMMQAGHTK